MSKTIRIVIHGKLSGVVSISNLSRLKAVKLIFRLWHLLSSMSNGQVKSVPEKTNVVR